MIYLDDPGDSDLVLGQVVVLEVGQHAPQTLPVCLILRHAHDAAPLPASQLGGLSFCCRGRLPGRSGGLCHVGCYAVVFHPVPVTVHAEWLHPLRRLWRYQLVHPGTWVLDPERAATFYFLQLRDAWRQALT